MKKAILRSIMKQRTYAYEMNLKNIKALLKNNKGGVLVDLGCDDGAWTSELIQIINPEKTIGLEYNKDQKDKAVSNGVDFIYADLTSKFPLKDNIVDIVHANQVIEHLSNTDNFVDEIYRILKPGGVTVISTEILSSWHNIFALIIGYMPFSLTGISSKTAALGNPLDYHTGEEFFWPGSTWQHQRIFTIRGIKHLLELSGFKVEKILTSGYYPLGNWMSKLDKTHSAFMAIKAKKTKKVSSSK